MLTSSPVDVASSSLHAASPPSYLPLFVPFYRPANKLSHLLYIQCIASVCPRNRPRTALGTTSLHPEYRCRGRTSANSLAYFLGIDSNSRTYPLWVYSCLHFYRYLLLLVTLHRRKLGWRFGYHARQGRHRLARLIAQRWQFVGLRISMKQL